MSAEPAAGGRSHAEAARRPGVMALARYFLGLGATGFGGPIALAGYMQRDLVERRQWITREEYLEGLALAQLAPGPLAAQLAIYIGWLRGRIAGATLVALAFVLPSFVMVLGLSALYVRYGGLPWMLAAFYGIGPAAIAIVVRGAWKLARMTLGRDALLVGIFAASALATAWTGREIVWLVVAGGLVPVIVRARPRAHGMAAVAPPFAWLLTGVGGIASPSVLPGLGLYFAAAGTFVFGSGLAIVPFLHGGVVDGHHWLDDRQFLDAVAVAMITPGPVVITVAFIGFLVAGVAGACVSALGVFLPCWLFVILPAPSFQRYARNAWLKHFVAGVTAGAAGAIAGSVVVLGRRAIVDVPGALIGLGALGLTFSGRRIPEPILILVAGLAGLALRAF